jgi:hypothetical protein
MADIENAPPTVVPNLPDPDGSMRALEIELARLSVDIAEQIKAHHARLDPLVLDRAILRCQLAELRQQKKEQLRRAG